MDRYSEYKRTYYDDGSIESEYLVNDGKIEGSMVTYHSVTFAQIPNQIKFTRFFVNGLCNGKCVEYLERGLIYSEWYEVDGQKHGLQIIYNPYWSTKENYIIFHRLNYVNGVLDGKCESFYYNEKIGTVTYYSNGKRNGPTIEYGLDGHKFQETEFVNDSIITDINYTDGVLTCFTEYSNSKPVKRTHFDECGNGNIIEKGIYVYDDNPTFGTYVVTYRAPCNLDNETI